jgi:hypothetical protein
VGDVPLIIRDPDDRPDHGTDSLEKGGDRHT